ncbi:MAG TPA: YqaJ viral recombinase family protein [Candidatus Baltobacteraceae bacterium]|nr:YqaJ viral recombinase family protein [Candidatus Baltobacteraceae bacterium]
MNTTIVHDATWHEERRTGIGGSDAPVVAGVGLTSRYELWHVKAGILEPRDLSDNPKVEWGLRHEAAIFAKFKEMHPDWRVRRAHVMRRSKRYPWAFAHFDGLVWIPGEPRPVPIQMKAPTSPDHWGPNGSDEIPHYHFPQTQHEMAVAESDFAFEVALIQGYDYREYRVGRDQAYIDKLMADESSFYESIFTGEIPEPTTNDDFLHAYPAPEGSCIDEDGKIEALVAQLRNVKAILSTNEEREQELRTAILQKLGPHARAITKAKKNICSRSISERVSLREQKAILDLFPEVSKFASTKSVVTLHLAKAA